MLLLRIFLRTQGLVFSDFFLELKKYRNKWCFFDDDFSELTSKTGLLRFDIDYDPIYALEIANILSNVKLKASFFVMVDSEMYNIFTSKNKKTLKEISSLGHIIGLHYQFKNGVDISRLNYEYNILKHCVKQASPVVSWHNPDGDLIPLNELAEKSGFISTYSSKFFGQNCYISDSNLKNSPEEILNFVKKSTLPVIQVLLHPINWVFGEKDIRIILRRLFLSKVKNIDGLFDENRVWKKDEKFKQIIDGLEKNN